MLCRTLWIMANVCKKYVHMAHVRNYVESIVLQFWRSAGLLRLQLFYKNKNWFFFQPLFIQMLDIYYNTCMFFSLFAWADITVAHCCMYCFVLFFHSWLTCCQVHKFCLYYFIMEKNCPSLFIMNDRSSVIMWKIC